MSEWVLIDNPAFAGETPRLLTASCHDRTPFVSVGCPNGYETHVHEGQTAAIPDDAAVATMCHGCGELHVFPAGFFGRAFKEMRDAGWIE